MIELVFIQQILGADHVRSIVLSLGERLQTKKKISFLVEIIVQRILNCSFNYVNNQASKISKDRKESRRDSL